ncbi:ABC transporter substrate-binding protein [Betaproteobacteria bacterium GR16-43]|nr:ABC transporter substrate-binding protein [Betaproteobacteria bacterium GR16-43]
MRPALLALCFSLAAAPAHAATLRWSSQGDYLSADPHAQNEGLNNNMNDEIFERLTTRNKELAIKPALATSWEAKSPTVWRFNLRRGVTFHDGTPFTADDVVYSIERAQLPSSNFKAFAVPLGKARKVDDYTVELDTGSPSPLTLENVNAVRIMSKVWCEKHGAQKPQDFKTGEETYASRTANGTGPFMLVKREPEIATTLRRNPKWWGIAAGLFDGNVDEIVYRPIKSDATRMAALVSGELDLVIDPPLQNVPSLKQDAKLHVIEGPENRVVFMVMDQERDTLKYSNVKGKNPLKDLRVRKALYQAIDIDTIQRQVMRGQSKPTGSMVPSAARSYPALEPRLLPFDPVKAKALLAEAGYPDGFELGIVCPNNRYVNDERICTALASMFARIGVKVKLDTMPRAQFFQRVDQFDVSMHMYGWGGAAIDPGFTLGLVIHSRDGKGKGDFNSGRFVDPALDALIDASAVEMNEAKRETMLLQAMQRVREQVYTIPLHRQVIPWAARANVDVVHRADNVVTVPWVRIR